MRVEWRASTAELQQEWDLLARQLRAAPWMRPGWFRCWSDAFARGYELLTVRSSGGLVGIFPLVRGSWSVAPPVNWHSPGFDPLARDAEVARRLMDAAFADMPPTIALPLVPVESPARAAFGQVASERSYRLLELVGLRSPYVRIGGSFEDYLASLDRHHVKETQRRRRRLEELGQITLSIEDGNGDLDGALRDGFRLETSGWKQHRETAISSRPETLSFYGDLARWAASASILRLAFLRVDGRPIAFEFGLEEHGAFHVIKGGFDVEFRRYGPGGLLAYELIRRAFALGLERFELLGDDESYKLQWAHDVRTKTLVEAFAPGARGTAVWMVRNRGRRLLRRVRALLRR